MNWVPVSSDSSFSLETKRRIFLRRKFRGRFRTFDQKYSFYPWNYLVRIVYDPKKISSEDLFCSKLKKYLSNQAYRHGWRYMCFFKRENESIFLYGLFYFPSGSVSLEKGILKLKDGSCLCERSSYISEVFGINTFFFLEEHEHRERKIRLNFYEHLFSGERIIYSKGFPSSHISFFDSNSELDISTLSGLVAFFSEASNDEGDGE